MFKFGVILLMISANVITGDDVTDGTELVLSFLIHRHGDRTPLSTSFSTDEEALEALIAPYGYGQLTTAGKQRAYKLGQDIRQRYDELLAPEYNRSEVYIRSTDFTRTKKTILSALAAIYPLTGIRWNKNLDWEPVPYTTLPAKYDFNEANMNCPEFMSAFSSKLASPDPAFAAKHSELLAALSSIYDFDFAEAPLTLLSVYDVLTSQASLGLPLGAELEALYGDIEEATGEVWNLIFGLDEYIPLQAGPLLDEFYTYSKLVITGGDTQRLRIYSAHDFNVFSLKAVTKVDRQRVPKYASAYSLEVRKVISTGKYVVLPVYLPSPGEDVVYLQVEGCDLLCDYDQFVQLTKENARDVKTWRDECGFTDDLVVNDPE